MEQLADLLAYVFAYLRESVLTILRATPKEIFMATWPIFVIDLPRFTFTAWASVFVEKFDRKDKIARAAFKRKLLLDPPLVSVVVPAYNEGANLLATVRSLMKQSYPNIEIIIADDSSSDNTSQICRMVKGENVRTVRANARQGKAFGHNIGLLLSRGKYIVVCDGDTVFHPDAIMEVLLPFHKENVRGVAGNVKISNPGASIATRLQEFEYLLSIDVGRRFSSRANILWIISGAFGAFHADTIRSIGGWEVSPGEDKDITTCLRKMGHSVAFSPKAICYTDAPKTFRALVRQRLRWSRSLLLLGIRKHGDLLVQAARWKHKKMQNVISAWDIITYNIIFGSGAILVLTYITVFSPELLLTVLLIMGIVYPVVDLVNWVAALILASDKRSVLRLLPYTLISWFYVGIFLKLVMIFAWLDEFFFRSSYHDPYVPEVVRFSKPRWGERDPYAELRAANEQTSNAPVGEVA